VAQDGEDPKLPNQVGRAVSASAEENVNENGDEGIFFALVTARGLWYGSQMEPAGDARWKKQDGDAASASDSNDRRPTDRRAHERVPVDIEVDYQANDTFLFAYITDISAMGIFVKTDRPEEPGTRLNLRFCTPAGRQLAVAGEVVWVNPIREDGETEGRNPGMGIAFSGLTAEERDEILRMVHTFAYLIDKAEDARKRH
jgi:type IV pilus assembly protein PilZ